MFTVLWCLLATLLLSSSLVWLIDHNGMVLVNWLGYEAKTDILTAILLAVFFTIFVFALSYLLARIFAIKFPNLLKVLFKKTHLKRLEKLINRYHQSFEVMVKLLLALEAHDKENAKNLQKQLSKNFKNPSLNNFFLGKICFENRDFSEAHQYFLKFGENKHAKILALKSKFELAIENHDETSAIAYSNQILVIKKDDFQTARILFSLYKKSGAWQEAKSLIARYGSENFKDELQKRDIAVINSALAYEAYQQKKFFLAIKHAKIALKSENNFFPALEILLRSWLKLGFLFKVRWKIKAIWKENPHLILAEIFDLTYRKSSAKARLKMARKLAALNPESNLGKLAIGLVAFKISEFEQAKEVLRLSLLQAKSHRAYQLLAFTEKALNNHENFKKCLAKAKMLDRNDHYFCDSCGYVSSKWSAKCTSCSSYDSLEWNS